jgi:hypothetical protein
MKTRKLAIYKAKYFVTYSTSPGDDTPGALASSRIDASPGASLPVRRASTPPMAAYEGAAPGQLLTGAAMGVRDAHGAGRITAPGRGR